MTVDLSDGWTYATLPQIADINMGQSPPGSTYNDRGEGLPFFQGKADFGPRYPGVRTWCTEPKKIGQPGDVLISVRAPVGPTNVADRICVIGRGLAALTPLGGIPTEFILFALRLLEPELSLRGTGSTFTAINRSALEQVEIIVPPLAEQKRIVARVDELLARVNATRERLDKVPKIIKRFRQSVLAAACSGKLTEDWREAHPDVEPAHALLERKIARKGAKPGAKREQRHSITSTELPELPGEWCWATIQQLASDLPRSIQSGPFGSSLLHAEFQDTGILAIGIDNVLEGEFCLGRQHRISESKYEELKKYTARPLDVLVTVMATVGRCCVVPENVETAIVTKHVYRITTDHALLEPRYLMRTLQGDMTVDKQIQDRIIGQTRPGINGEILKSTFIPVPPISEQQEIVRRVHALLELADTVEKRVAVAKSSVDRLTQSILARAFRGELVPTEAELARQEGRSYEPAAVLLERIEMEREKSEPLQRKARRSGY